MNLKTKYLGLELRSPLVVSASPISEDIDNIKKMEDSGAAAVVLHSIFEEQFVIDQKNLFYHTENLTNVGAEATSYFPEADEYRLGPDEYLNHIKKAKESVEIPIIASLNGSSVGGWIDFAKKLESAGADAIELNQYYIPTDFDMTAEVIENNYIEVIKAVKSAVKVPVSVKLSPYFTNVANMAKKIDATGANGLVLFNRFYQPDIDIEHLEVKPHIHLSNSNSTRLPMRWIAILHGKVKADLAATSGIHTGEDVLKMLLAGANVTMLCSSILKYGINHISHIESEIVKWLTEKEYESVQQMIGSMSQMKSAEPSSFERAQYMKALSSYKF
jgi:dihydroorotate dehydrogenase (fumarate)